MPHFGIINIDICNVKVFEDMRKLINPDREVEGGDKVEKKLEKIAGKRPGSILEAFEYIVEFARDSELDEKFFELASVPIGYAAQKLKLTKMQTALLAIFVDRSDDTSIRLSEIANYAGCRTTRILRLGPEIDVLEDKHYLCSSSRCNSATAYRVPEAVLKALRENRPYIYVSEPVTSVQDFFDRFDSMMQEMDNNETSHKKLLGQTIEHLEEVKDSYFARSLKSFCLDDEEQLLFIFMAHLFIENSDDCIGFHDIDDLYDNGRIPGWCKYGLRNRTIDLFDKKLIENSNEDGMARSDSFKLTDYAKNDVLSELKLNTKAKAEQQLIKSDSFATKKLFYNPSEEKQVAELSAILSQERFKEVQSRLKAAGMRTGFCSLFYGSPGTGKTETVYQIARATGRDILRVDVDKIKSCWVGESEQNMKRLFDRYRNICKDAERAPIQLFNEADAILGVRMEGASRAVDKMENSIQNIILQEMEALEGIMIATTNLTSNLDKAFERRFLYKIEFSRPTTEARAHIWQSMMPGLSEDDARILATRFDLSGGEIENITRKYTVNAILSGSDSADLDAISEICSTERISGPARARIGF